MVDVHVESNVVIQYCMPLPTHTRLYSGVMATIPSLLCTVVNHIHKYIIIIITIVVYRTVHITDLYVYIYGSIIPMLSLAY